MTAKPSATGSARALAKAFNTGFGMELSHTQKQGVVSFTEGGTPPKELRSTQSARRNWVRRRALASGFVEVRPNEFKFVGETEEEPDNQS